jgi:glycosyltransferase involved in cell wall biosynthesis
MSLKILFITDFNPYDVTLRSGVPFFILQGIKELGHEVTVLQVADKRNGIEKIWSRLQRFYYNKGQLFSKSFFHVGYSHSVAKSFRRNWKNIHFASYDRILTISPRTVSYLPEGVKPIIWIDNTLSTYAMYPEMQNIHLSSLKEGNEVEERAFRLASTIYCASNWLYQDFVEKYPMFQKKCGVMPRGANFQEWPEKDKVSEWIDGRCNNTVLELLHIVSSGIENDRKGTQSVLKTFLLLKKTREVRLTIAGNVPESFIEKWANDGITFTGRINKQNEPKRYMALLSKAHFLMVPSKADGFGIVFAEAAATGLPSLALNIMGVGSAVIEGITGFLMPFGTEPGEWVQKINDIFNSKEKYNHLCNQAYHYASEHFKWSNNIKHIVEKD